MMTPLNGPLGELSLRAAPADRLVLALVSPRYRGGKTGVELHPPVHFHSRNVRSPRQAVLKDATDNARPFARVLPGTSSTEAPYRQILRTVGLYRDNVVCCRLVKPIDAAGYAPENHLYAAQDVTY